MRRAAVFILIPVLLFGLGRCAAGRLVALSNIAGSQDVEESRRIYTRVLENFPFKPAPPDSTEAGVFQRPRARYTDIIVYGDYTPAEQEEICGAVRKARREIATKPVNLYFHRHRQDAWGKYSRRETFK